MLLNLSGVKCGNKMPSCIQQHPSLVLLIALAVVGATACGRDLSKNRVEIKRTLDDFAPRPPDPWSRGDDGQKKREEIDHHIGMITRLIHSSGSEEDGWGSYIQRGSVYFGERDYKSAVADLEKGVNLGETKKRSDRQKGVVGYGYDFDRGLFGGYKLLGTTYYALGDHARAKKMYTHVIENRPRDWEAYDYLGLVLESEGDYTSAISAYSRGIEKAPYDKLYYDRGCAYANMGDLEKALRDFAKVAEGRSPFRMNAQFHQARVLEKQGMKHEALAAYKKVVAMITYGVPLDIVTVPKPAVLTEALDRIQELEQR